jgi:hypothetical protein
LLANDIFNTLSGTDTLVSSRLIQTGGLTGTTIHTGNISVLATSKTGTYIIEYEICARINADICSRAFTTIIIGDVSFIPTEPVFIPKSIETIPIENKNTSQSGPGN